MNLFPVLNFDLELHCKQTAQNCIMKRLVFWSWFICFLVL